MPARVGTYEPFARIGRGGMADVYAALDDLGEVRALKVQHRESTSGRAALEREFQLQSWVEHPALVRAFDTGVLPDGRGWVAMEYVDGVLAREWVGNDRVSGALRASRTVQVIAQVARALAALHKRGLVHGDVKPSNILVQPDGAVRLMDLGMARFVHAEWFGAGHFAGTTRYASPEQLGAVGLTPAADVFSLAASAYALLRGRSPFGNDRDRSADHPPPDRLLGVNALLGELLLAALEADPALRPSAALIADLAESELPQVEPEQPRPTDAPRSPELLPSHQQLLALLAIAGHPVETSVIGVATETTLTDLRPLLEDLFRQGRLERAGPSWSTQGEPPARAPWNEALAEGLLRALDPWPNLARAHALHHLGRLDEAAREAARLGRVSERLARIEGHAVLSELRRREVAATDRSLLDGPPEQPSLRPTGDGPLAQGFRAARRGDGVEALRLAAAARSQGAEAEAVALLQSRGLLLQGRASAAADVLRRLLEGGPDRTNEALALIELASVQHHIGRTQLARDLLRRARARLPARPTDALLARWIRVSGELDVALGRQLDADMLREARVSFPSGGDARVLAALEVLARIDGPDDAVRREAIASATAPGDDHPDLAVALALSIRVTGQLPDLPPGVAGWLAVPGAERWQLDLLLTGLEREPAPGLQKQVHEAANRMLAAWGEGDSRVFVLNPRWQLWIGQRPW